MKMFNIKILVGLENHEIWTPHKNMILQYVTVLLVLLSAIGCILWPHSPGSTYMKFIYV